MAGQRDDALTRDALMELIEAVRIVGCYVTISDTVDKAMFDFRLAESKAKAERIDKRRGIKAESVEG